MINFIKSINNIVYFLGVCYFDLIFFFFLSKIDDIRQYLKIADDSLGVPLHQKNYGVNCMIYDNSLSNPFYYFSSSLDKFLLAHLLGWIGKSLLFRNWSFIISMSILFEIVEASFANILVNFNECWWDHIILDILICNALGSIIGMKIVKYFGKVKVIKFDLIDDKLSIKIKQNPRHYFSLILKGVILMVLEINAFTIKQSLWIPTENPINTIRLLLNWSISMFANEEIDNWSDGKVDSIGKNVKLIFSIMFVEMLMILKFIPDSFQYLDIFGGKYRVIPANYICICWFLFFGMCSLWSYICYNFNLSKSICIFNFKFYLDRIMTKSLFIIPIPLIFILIMDVYRTLYFSSNPPVPGISLGW